MMEHLQENLSRAGQTALPLTGAEGSRLLVLPQFGRLLGLYPADGEANFLWTNPALADATAAAAYLARDGWPNPGGDRTWLAPEVRLFISDPARPGETYRVPPELDPGHWTVARSGTSEVALESVTRLRWLRTPHTVALRLGKHYRAAANPLPPSRPGAADLRYAGFTLTTTLAVEEGTEPSIRPGLWNLLQLPQPGRMLVPTQGRGEPQIFFGDDPAGALTVADGMVGWEMSPPGGDAKIGLQASVLTGRAGYWRPLGRTGLCDLVVREFAVDPAGDYVDAHWKTGATGWGFQACCVRNGAECFNELEYHAPAVGAGGVQTDVSTVWAFRGAANDIAAAAQTLLGGASLFH